MVNSNVYMIYIYVVFYIRVPVIRRSSITSCYDDSDNVIGGTSRASIPVVVVDKWSDVNESRLNWEWKRITSYSREHWDWKRLFIDHWFERIDGIK